MMRRRRPFLQRAVFRQAGLRALETGPRQRLSQANRMMETGNFSQAAVIFDQLAQGAMARGLINRAPFLFLQAGQAFFSSGDSKSGKDRLLRGLKMLAESGRQGITYKVGQRSIQELQQLGLLDVAQEVSNWLNQVLPEPPELAIQPDLSQRRKIPPKCPYCGGTVIPAEVEWLDDSLVECTFCGSSIQVE